MTLNPLITQILEIITFMQIELAANVLVVAGLTFYLLRFLREEPPSGVAAAVLFASGMIMVVGSIMLMLFLDTLPASERVVDVLLLTRFRVVPGGAIPVGYACILTAAVHCMGLLAAKKRD
jgi:hypothetical protein